MKRDRSWGHFTDEHRESLDGDNRGSFLQVLDKKQAKNRDHLLYLWHLIDMHGILENVLNVLSKDVAVDSDGKIRIGAQETQTKRRATIEKEEEKREQKKLRKDVGTAMNVFVKSSTEDSLTAKRQAIVDLEERLTENEVKELMATDPRVRACYGKLIAKQHVHLQELSAEVESLKKSQKEQEEEDDKPDEPEEEEEDDGLVHEDDSDATSGGIKG